jgi:hypothetical protein
LLHRRLFDVSPLAMAAALVPLSLVLGCSPPAPPLSDLEKQVFTRSCAFSACHPASTSPAGGLSLAGGSYEKLVNVKSTLAPDKLRVVPFQPDQSFFFEKIAQEKPSVGKRMPPGQPLPDEEIAQIRAWIEAGAENK